MKLTAKQKKKRFRRRRERMIDTAVKVFKHYINGAPREEILAYYNISETTFYRYINYMKVQVVKPSKDTVIQAIQSTISQIEACFNRICDNPHTSELNQVRALGVKVKALAVLARVVFPTDLEDRLDELIQKSIDTEKAIDRHGIFGKNREQIRAADKSASQGPG